MMINMSKKFTLGQTLLEVIFVMVLITVALGAFVFTATRSVRSTTNTASRSVGTKYAQQGMEIVRQLRDRNWTNFLSYADSTRCPSADTTIAWAEGACTIEGEYDDFYTRSATFEWDADNEFMTVVVNVEWTDDVGLHNSSLKSIFTRL